MSKLEYWNNRENPNETDLIESEIIDSELIEWRNQNSIEIAPESIYSY